MTIPPAHSRASRFRTPAVLLIGGVSLFIAIAADVTHQGKLVQLDRAVAPYLYAHADGTLILLASGVSGLGELLIIAPYAIVGGVLLAARRRWRAMAVWAAAFIGSAVICDSLKAFFHIPRPQRYHNFVFRDNSGFTFPSGHTMAVTIAAGVTVLVLLHVAYRPPRVRRMLVAAAAGLGVLVAAALVYVGVHYVSDVLGGLAISAAWVGVLRALLPPAALPPAPLSPLGGTPMPHVQEISDSGG